MHTDQHSATFTSAGLLLATLFLVSGCLSRPPLKQQSFTFSGPATASTNATPNGPVLQIRRITVAPPYDSQTFAYRTGTASYERDTYAQFLVPPAESLQSPIRRYLLATGAFGDVTTRDSLEPANLLLEVQVDQLYGDFRNKSKPEAVLAIEFVLYNARQGSPETIRLRKEYRERVPFQPPKASALMEAWNKALRQIMTKFSADLRNR